MPELRHSEQKAALDSESREANEDDYVRPVTQSDVNGWRRNLGDFAAGRLPFELTVFPYLRRDTRLRKLTGHGIGLSSLPG